MERKRLIRFVCILVSNGTILFFALRLLRALGAANASEAHFDMTVGAVASSACLIGFVAEINLHRWAKVINVAIPMAVGIFMASAVMWLPAVSNDGDRYEAAYGFLIYATIPLFFALANFLAYRLTNTAKDAVTNSQV
ncbi:MAG TPA: hypothetical protein VFI95_03940 [Terriglobales bacterium]|jgi:hypothetical protein|nr:hypothetical protein [Terriglobales bacterium]